MPSPIPDREIQSLRTVVESGLELEPTRYLSCGDKVQVCQGPLVGLQGIVVRVANSDRLVISVDLITKSVMVQVPSSTVVALAA